jgi:signal transduction histidine kinase
MRDIVVSDNGTMIEPFVAEHIFEPFVLADASRESKGGSGLGLSIAKKIVEMHGWTIGLHQDFERQEKSFVIKIRK